MSVKKHINRELDYDYYESDKLLYAVYKDQWDKLNSLKSKYKELAKAPDEEFVQCYDMNLNKTTNQYERNNFPVNIRVNTMEFIYVEILNPNPFRDYNK